jgi:regulator of protease activity HflC (stomatin/prohibitin superfamily)
MGWLFFGLVFIFALLTLFLGLFTVSQQTAAVVERFGKFLWIAQPGLNFKMPWIDYVAGVVNLRVQQLDVKVETKTSDNVFVHVIVSVQYYVLPTKIYESFYKLENAERQITSYVFDAVRARVPKLTLDDVFEKKDEIADVVKSELTGVMDQFGYGTLTSLVTDIDPDPKVKIAMNEINAATRERVAANERGEAERILMVKRAQGEAETKALQGRGIADQRRAIVEGLRDSVEQFQSSVRGATAQDVMSLVLMTQFFDTLKDIGANSRSNTLFVPHSPGGMTEIYQQLLTAIMNNSQSMQVRQEPPPKS